MSKFNFFKAALVLFVVGFVACVAYAGVNCDCIKGEFDNIQSKQPTNNRCPSGLYEEDPPTDGYCGGEPIDAECDVYLTEYDYVYYSYQAIEDPFTQRVIRCDPVYEGEGTDTYEECFVDA